MVIPLPFKLASFLNPSGFLKLVASVGVFAIVYVLIVRGLEATRIWAFRNRRSPVDDLYQIGGRILAMADGLAVAGTVLAVDGLLVPAFGATLLFVLWLVTYRLRRFAVSQSGVDR